MPCRTQADWWAEQLRRNDWVSRHTIFRRISVKNLNLALQIAHRMDPTELLEGRYTGDYILQYGVLACRDIKRKNKKQMARTAKAVQERKWVQTSLYDYFVRKPKPTQ